MYNLVSCSAYTNKYVMVVANALQNHYRMAMQLSLVAKMAKSHGCHSVETLSERLSAACCVHSNSLLWSYTYSAEDYFWG